MKKYKLDVNSIGCPMDYVFRTLKRGDILYFDSGFFRIALGTENYVVYGHNNQEIESPDMQEIFNLFN